LEKKCSKDLPKKFQKFGPKSICSIREHNKYLKYALVDEKQHALHKICGNYEILV